MSICDLPISELKEALDSQRLSAREVTEAYLKQAERLEPQLDAFNSLARDRAIAEAIQWDQRRASGETLPPLAGIPIAIKDNICTLDDLTTCSSKLLANYQSPYEASVIRYLREAGAIVMGKTNMDEFGMGSSTENSGFKPTRNPWDLTRVPGGSSGGSAAAVAAGQAPWALGSDTGGSIRQPAALCGVVGMKPTYGRVSRYGLVAFASSLDQIGPITRNVRDNALLLSAIARHDTSDSTSLPESPVDYVQGIDRGVQGLRVGIITESMAEGLTPDVRAAVERSRQQFESLGATVGEISLPYTQYALAVYYIICTAEASSNLARFDGVRYGVRAKDTANITELFMQTRAQGFGDEVKRRIMLGTYALSSGYYEAYYKKAQQVRTLLIQDFQRAFESYDILITPTTPMTAFQFGEKADPLSMYLTDITTITVNLAGIPALSLPYGFDRNGLPIGLQIIGSSLREEQIYQAAYALEQANDFHLQRPPIASLAMSS